MKLEKIYTLGFILSVLNMGISVYIYDWFCFSGWLCCFYFCGHYLIEKAEQDNQ